METEFSYWGHRLRIVWATGCEPVVAFLRSYFSPYFEIQDRLGAAPGVARVEVDIRESVPGAPNFDGAGMIIVDRSGGFLYCEGRTVSTADGLWIKLMPFQVVIRVDPDQRRIQVWAPRPDLLRVPLLRIVEDFVLNAVQNSGGVVLHASGVVAGGHAILLVGNKKAGKTTGLCRLLSGYWVSKLANDNVCLMLRDGQLLVRGWPAFFKVSVATTALFRELNADFPEDRRSSLDDDDSLWGVYEKVALYPEQGAERFGTRIEPEAPLGGIIYPEYRPDAAPGIHAIESDPGSGGPRLTAFLQGFMNPNHCEWLGIDPVSPDEVRNRLATIERAIARTAVPQYEMTWAPSLEELFGRADILRPFNKGILNCKERQAARGEWPPLPSVETR